MSTGSGFSFGSKPPSLDASAATLTTISGFSLNTSAVTTTPTSVSTTPSFGAFSLPIVSSSATSSTTGSNLSINAQPTLTTASSVTATTSVPATQSGLTGGNQFGVGSTLTTTAAPKTSKHVTFNIPTSTTISSIGSTADSQKSPLVSTIGATNTPLNYEQLQDFTNKCLVEFNDMQKLLLNQTSEIINRDIVLARNEEQIEKLVNCVSDLKVEQAQIDQQLDFILSQQKDLDECLTSLEEEVSSYFPELPVDDVYKFAENIDSRIKKSLDSSKEIITEINSKSKSSENDNNPLVTMCRVLNHLTNSIQMLENLNAEGQNKLSELQKLYQQYA